MRRIVMSSILLVAALTLVASGLADPGGKGKGKKNGQNRFTASIVVTDHGSCGNAWATDTSKRTWSVKKNNDGTFRVGRTDHGTFVTLAGQSPGACETKGKHGHLLNAGINGKFQGYLRGTVSNGTFNPTATCTAACIGDTTVFISTYFGSGATVHVLARVCRLQVQLPVQLAEQNPEIPPLAGPWNEWGRRAFRRRHRQLLACNQARSDEEPA